jgi:uridine kinase
LLVGCDGIEVHTTMLKTILDSLEKYKDRCGETKIIAIDGPAGSGKTTLALQLEAALSPRAATIHMDALYNGWSDALTPTLTRTLQNQIFTPLSLKKKIEYRPFDWFSHAPGPVITVEPPEILILEGVGSAQAVTRKYAALLIWIEVAPEVGLKRVLHRDGAEIENQMRIWQSQEANFFAKDQTRERVHLRMDGNTY